MGKIKEIKHSKGYYVYRVVRNTVLGIIIALLAALIVLIIITRVSGGTPTVFGYSMYRVSSGSMAPELEIGDVILTSECDPMTVKTGEIITYKGESGDMAGKFVTHRVVKAPYKEGGKFYLVTKGDNNYAEDNPITLSQVNSRFVTKVSILKMLYNVFVTPVGLLIIIGLIIFAFFNEIIIFVKALLGISYEEEKQESVDDIIERYMKENNENKLPDSDKKSEDENDSGGEE